jgi:hypothetical protein
MIRVASARSWEDRPGTAMTERQAINDAFLHARTLAGAERAAWLADLHAKAPALHDEVQALLAADAAAAASLQPPEAETMRALLPRAPDRIGEGVAGCRLLRVIAEGGMGVVYEAEQEEPKRRVAVKMLRGAVRNAEDLARFRHEVRIVGRLRHPGIVQVHRAGTTDDGAPFLVMELIKDAKDLLTHCQPLALRERLACLIAVCDAVQFGHGQGVIHRDLKPANVLVGTDGRPRLVDFGIARILLGERNDETVPATRTGAIFGTLAYLSPEQVRRGSAAADARSDVYALGVMLYELATGGRSPYGEDKESEFKTAERILRMQPEPSGAPEDLDLVIRKALRKQPDERYASADALAADLRRFLDRQPVTARPPSAVYQVRMFTRRHRLGVSLGALGVVALAATTAWSLVATHRANQQQAVAMREAGRARDMLLESQSLITTLLRDHARLLDDIPGTLPARINLGDTLQASLARLEPRTAGDTAFDTLRVEHHVQLGTLNARSLKRPDAARENFARATEMLDALDARGQSHPQRHRMRARIALELSLLENEGSPERAQLVADALRHVDDADVSSPSQRLRAQLLLARARATLSSDPDNARADLALVRKLQATLPPGVAANTEWQEITFTEGLTSAHLDLTDAKVAREGLARADAALSAIQDRAGTTPHRWLREAAWLAGTWASWATQHGDPATSIERAEASIDAFDRAQAADTEDLALRDNLARMRVATADLRLRTVKRMSAALLGPDPSADSGEQRMARAHISASAEHARRAVRVLDALLAKIPGKIEWLLTRAMARLTLADALAFQGRQDEAQDIVADVLLEADDLEARAPRSWRVAMVRRNAHDLRAMWATLRANALMDGKPQAAGPHLEEAIRSLEALADGLAAARARGATHQALPDLIAGARKAAEQLRAQRELARNSVDEPAAGK